MRWLRHWLPNQCPLCQAVHAGDSWLCSPCLTALPRLGPSCPRCAAPLPVARTCPACLRHPPPQARTRAALHYRQPLDRLIQDLKFHGHLGLAGDLGQVLSEAVTQGGETLPTALLPVPLHRSRLRERGFNQAEEIARAVARRLGLPLWRGARRIRATRPQSTLDARGRRGNLAGAFAIRGRPPQHVALIDDVMTTGHTASSLAECLRKAGVARVEVWVVARAGRRPPG